MKLTWSAPTDNGGSAIDAYKVYYSTTSTMGTTPYTTISSGSTFTATVGSLTNGQLYYFWVVAHNAQGDSAASNSLTATPGISVPDAPTSLSSTATGDGSIDVSWTAPVYDGGSAIVRYDVYYTATAYITSTATSCSITGLTNGTPYTVFVKAYNAQGEGLASNTITATPYTVPSKPTNVAVTGAASVTWTAPANNGSTITSYTVRYSNDSFATHTDQTTTTNSCVISLPTTGTWSFKVFATNSRGDGPESDVVSITTTQVATPAFVSPEATYLNSVSVELTCATSGASIRYTTNGDTPTSASTLYSSAITVSTTATIKAKAFATGMVDSATASATYTIQVGAPSFSPAAGSYTAIQTVTITAPTGAAIQYRKGSDSFATYSAPITVDTTATYDAYATRSGCTDSSTTTAAYTITITP